MKDETAKKDELPKVSKETSSNDRPMSEEETGKVSGGAIRSGNPDPEEDPLIP